MKNIILTLMFFLWALPVSTATAKNFSATYDVYASGLHALQARLNYDDTDGHYSVSMESETYGMLGKLVPWSGIFSTKGVDPASTRQPLSHVSDTTYRKDREINTYKYGKNGIFRSVSQTINGTSTNKDFDLSLAQGTTDILSATLEVMDQLPHGKGCGHASKIFDTERRFVLKFKDQGVNDLKKNNYSSFVGPAQSCSVEVVPDGGKWHKKPRGWLSIQEQGRKKGTLPTIWFARVSKNPDAPAVPVKIFLKTDYGAFVIHLTSFEEKPAK